MLTFTEIVCIINTFRDYSFRMAHYFLKKVFTITGKIWQFSYKYLVLPKAKREGIIKMYDFKRVNEKIHDLSFQA